MSQKASGFYHKEITVSSNGDPEYSTLFRFVIKRPAADLANNVRQSGAMLYEWIKLTFHVRWEPPTRILIMCFDAPAALQEDIRQTLRDHTDHTLLHDPFTAHACVIEHILRLYDDALWLWRDFLRNHENNRPSVDYLCTDYYGMHELARHIIHSSETLACGTSVTNSAIEDCRCYQEHHPPSSDSNGPEYILQYCKSMFESLHLRSKALEERLNNEMNLVRRGPLTTF